MERNDRADAWRARLSEYLDGELADSEREELEEHLKACEECSEVLAELRQVVASAGRLVDAPPATDLWPEIRKHLRDGEISPSEEVSAGATRTERTPASRAASRADSRGKTLTFSVPQLAAAAVLLVALSSGIAWQVAGGFGSNRAEPAAPVVVRAPISLLPVAPVASGDYLTAIAQLERALEEGRSKLDTATIRKVEERLAIVDRAIEEARQALAADPANAYLNRYLAGAMRRKLDLLRRTAALTEL